MIKKILLLLSGVVFFAHISMAQEVGGRPCYSDEVRARYIRVHPEAAKMIADFDKQLEEGLKHIDYSVAHKTTGDANELDSTNFVYDIPIVVHIIHNYGQEYLTDNAVFNDLLDWNIVYAGANSDTASVIAPFKKYIGNPHLKLHLANKDPNGNPTKGITRHRSYLATSADDQAKFDDWPPSSYVNIWVINQMSKANNFAAAYAYFPSQAALTPYYDGVITIFSYLANSYTGGLAGYSKTVNHEMGHVFNLEHPWGNTNSACDACGDDGVDDTPPTKGHGVGDDPTGATCNALGGFGCTDQNLSDTTCASRTAQVGTGNDVTIVNSPFSGTAKSAHEEYLITKNELLSAGVESAVPLTSMLFNILVGGKHSAHPFTNFTIKLGNTTATTLAGGYVSSSLTQVYSGTVTTVLSVGAAGGWNGFIFSNNFMWDGNSNLAVEVCYNKTTALDTANDVVQGYRDTSYISSVYDTALSGTGSGCSLPHTAGNTSNVKPVIRFNQLGYYKIYPRTDSLGIVQFGSDSLVDYPDTTNSQNIMDYTYCSRMFTNLQVFRMHDALNSDVAGRNSLWSKANLQFTGVKDANNNDIGRSDLPPIADFSVDKFFTAPCASAKCRVKFTDRSWNDTITSVAWSMTNGASIVAPNSTNTYVTFTSPGWVSVTDAATGNNTSTTSIVDNGRVYVTETTATPAEGYVQDFAPGGDISKWPIFNIYNNEFKWQLSNAPGVYDNNCIQYVGYDTRANQYTGMPQGDFDDFYTVPFDLSTFTDTVNLDYMYTGATRSSLSADMNDTLEIAYSTDSTNTWVTLKKLTKGQIASNGVLSVPYAPLYLGDWSPMTIGLPAAARKPYTLFRFRYRPGVAGYNPFLMYYPEYSTGNNFYMDRITFSRSPAEVSSVSLKDHEVAVVPNPTSGSAFVIIKDAANTNASISVTDITGKVVYAIQKQLNGSQERIEIPQSYISVKGMYIVNIVTGNQAHSEKLVVY